MRALVGLLSALSFVSTVGPVGLAQPGEGSPGWATIREASGNTYQLGALPDDHELERDDGVTFSYPRAARAEAHTLRAELPGIWSSVRAELGGDIDGRLQLRLARNPEEMRAIGPTFAPPPRYAVGVAYPEFGLVLLTLTAPDTWVRPPMHRVLAHELSHIALHRAAKGANVPRWFAEGLAIEQAGEQDLERARVLSEAAASGQLLPLAQLSEAFFGHRRKVGVAYAQAAHFVAFLRRDEAAFQRLLVQLRGGQPWVPAVRAAYDETLVSLDARWRAEFEETPHSYLLFVDGNSVWVLAAALLLVAWWRRRREARKKLAQWEREERLRADLE